MGIFKKKEEGGLPPSSDPIVTYHITQALNGKLTVTPKSPSYNTYHIVLDKPKTFRDSIDISVVHATGTDNCTAQHEGVVGHCVTQVSTGKFLDFSVSDNSGLKLSHSGHGSSSKYSLQTEDGALKDARWVHDSLPGRTKSEGRLKLENGNGILARFAGAGGSVSEFGMLEIYDQGVAARDAGVDWCGLVILTAVCVYLREERHREKQAKVKGGVGVLGGVGDVLGLVGGV